MKKLNHHVLIPSSRDREVTREAIFRNGSAIPSIAVNAARSALYAGSVRRATSAAMWSAT